jgi:hypothetical protein
MSGESPASTLFNAAGVELAVTTGSSIPVGTPALLLAGEDSTGNAQRLTVDGYGRQIIVSDPDSPISISGSITATNPSVGVLGGTPPLSATQIGGPNNDGVFNVLEVTRQGHMPVAAQALNGYAGEVTQWPVDNQIRKSLTADDFGGLYTRGQVMTDEGSFTDVFSTLETSLTGTVSFENNSVNVVGVGTAFLSEINYYSLVKKATDADSLLVEVEAVLSDTELRLSSPYQGTTASGVSAVETHWYKQTASGGTITISSNTCVLTVLQDSAQAAGIETIGDYVPFLGTIRAQLSARATNQTTWIGYADTLWNGVTGAHACFLFDGTTNTTVKCSSGTGRTTNTYQETTVTIPGGLNSSSPQNYRIVPWQGQVAFFINGNQVAVHDQYVIPPYVDVRFGIYTVNTSTATDLTVTLYGTVYESIDRFDVRVYNTNADLLQATVSGKTTTGLTVPLQVSTAGIAVVSGAVTLSGTSNTVRGNVTQYTADGTAAVANSLPVIAQMLATKAGANTLDRLWAGPTNADGEAVETVGALLVKDRLYGFNGTTWDRLRSTTANGLAVDVSRVQGTVTVGGINAAGGGITGNPLRIGGSDGSNTRDIQTDTAGNLEIVGTGVAGTPAGGVLSIQGVAGGTAIPVSGTVTAANASVSTTGSAPPASATYVGAKVGTTEPSYTNGNMEAPSLTTAGRLRVDSQFLNVVDSGNSTTTPLGANATFTGTAVDLLAYASITYSVFTDQDSAANGVVCQFSPDNVNWDDRIINTKTADGTVSDFSARSHDRYFRIKYTNGATPQTTFRFQTILKRYMPAGDTTGVDHPPHSGDDALLVKAVMSGKSTVGGVTYVDVKVNPSGTIQIGGGDTPAEGHANPTDAQLSTAFNMGWNGSTWDRIQAHGNDIDSDTVETTGSLAVCSHNMMFNGTSWDRIRGTIANGQLVDVSRVQGSVAVTGTFWQATQPVSGTITAAQATAANLNATVVQGNAGTAAQGWFAKVTDGTNTAAVKAASTAAVASDPALVVAISPNNSLTVKEPRPSSASQANVAISATSVTLLASNTNRLRYSVINDTNKQAYVSHSGAASTTNYKYTLQPGEYYEDPFPCFTGAVTIIWSGSGTGSARVTEET